MAVNDQLLTEDYAIYNGDCIEVMQTLPDLSVGLTVYSPPFAGLYQYSSDARDMSNCIDKEEFFEHYGYCIDEIARLTKPGRISAVHCMDIPLSNAGCDAMFDLPGRIILEHEKRGWSYGGRRVVRKEPLMELFLRPLADVNDVTWSIVWCLIILLAGVFYVIVYILGIDERESHGSNGSTEQEELLQLQSDGD